MTEAQLQEAVADYLRLKYPDVIFHSDFGSGIKLAPGQAVRQKRQNGGRRAWPDLFIAEPMTNDGIGYQDENSNKVCVGKRVPLSDVLEHWTGEFAYNSACGLFLELKKEGIRLKKNNGDWATEHIAEQADVLEKLRARGYCAEFAVGFDEAKQIIDEYLGG